MRFEDMLDPDRQAGVRAMQTFRWGIVAAAFGAAACTTAISGSADGISRLERAQQANPSSQAAVRNLGIAYFKATPPRLEQAATALRRAVTMDPKDGVAALYLGLTSEAQNNLPEARK